MVYEWFEENKQAKMAMLDPFVNKYLDAQLGL